MKIQCASIFHLDFIGILEGRQKTQGFIIRNFYTKFPKDNSVFFSVISVAFFFFFGSLKAENQFPLSYKLDIPLILGSATLDLSANYYNDKYVDSLSLSQIANAKKDNIPFFDRFAVDMYDVSLKDLSDITAFANILLPMFSSFFMQREYFVSDMVMYGEILFLQSGVAKWSKYLTKRNRPFVYNTDISFAKKQEKNSRHSFFSMHSSTAFSSAVFGSYLYQQRGGEYSTYFWIISLGLASSTATLRVASGSHFPSDVIVGAMVGSFIGYAIPYLHKKINNERFSIYVASNSFYCEFRW